MSTRHNYSEKPGWESNCKEFIIFYWSQFDLQDVIQLERCVSFKHFQFVQESKTSIVKTVNSTLVRFLRNKYSILMILNMTCFHNTYNLFCHIHKIRNEKPYIRNNERKEERFLSLAEKYMNNFTIEGRNCFQDIKY